MSSNKLNKETLKKSASIAWAIRAYILSPFKLLFNKKVFIASATITFLYFFAPQPIPKAIESVVSPVWDFSRAVARELGFFTLLGHGSDLITGGDEIENSLGQEIYYAGIPNSKDYPNPIQILENDSFSVGYDNLRQNPAWACYRLYKNMIDKDFEKPKGYAPDKRTHAKLSPNAYQDVSYLPGSLVPHQQIGKLYGEEALKSSFNLSNTAPQQLKFSAGLWNDLQGDLTSKYAIELEEIWVISGPIFGDNPKKMASGLEIPDSFFMIMIDEKKQKVEAQAFIIPQNAKRNHKISSYLVSVDEVEAATELDFLHELEDSIENELEKKSPNWKW